MPGRRAAWRACLSVTALVVTLAAPARGDIWTAVEAYRRGEYDTARAEFQALAELGQPRAQYLLGATLVQGDGAVRDPAAGIGWMRAAIENGFALDDREVDDILGRSADLSPADRARMLEVLQHYGASATASFLTPAPRRSVRCPGYAPPTPFDPKALATFRIEALPNDILRVFVPESVEVDSFRIRTERLTGLDSREVRIQLTVGIDGRAREPEVLRTFPIDKEYEVAALRVALSTHYRPAELSGRPTESALVVIWAFMGNWDWRVIASARRWDAVAIEQAKSRVATGDLGALYTMGEAALGDVSGFGLTWEQARANIVRAAQAGFPRAQYRVATLLASDAPCGEDPRIERWLRAAALGGDPAAQVRLARKLLVDGAATGDQADAKRLLEAAARSGDRFAVRHAAGILATSPFGDVRNAALALSALNSLTAEAYEADPQTWEAHAAAQAANGNFDAAVRLQHRSLRLAKEFGWNTVAMDARLNQYRHRTAWTGDLFVVPPMVRPRAPSDAPRK